ncbi:MAG: outer membrane protein assembly factor BamB [Xanthomonadales bacterium]|nr:outer membrane protein assembly factor BamB [Xanthomonadales bacterium]
MLRRTLLLSLLLALQGCFLFGEDDEELAPAPLVEINTTLQIQREWSAKLDGSGDAEGMRFDLAFKDGQIFAASPQGTVSAVSLENGRQLWKVDTDLPISAGVGVEDDLLALGTTEGEVVALSATNGAERWRAQVSSEVLVPPIVHREMVVVRGQDGRVFGFGGASGTREWVFDRAVPTLSLRGNGPMVALAGFVYFGLDNGNLVALRVADGSVVWEETVARPEGRNVLERLSDVDGHIAVIASDLYAVGYQGRIRSFTSNTGRLLWARELSSFSGVAASRTLLAVSDSDDAVWGLDRLSGGTLWKQDALARRQLTSPVHHGDSVVVGDFEGYLHWMSREDGDFQARTQIDSRGLSGSPLVVGDRLVVLGRSGRLASYRIRGG